MSIDISMKNLLHRNLNNKSVVLKYLNSMYEFHLKSIAIKFLQNLSNICYIYIKLHNVRFYYLKLLPCQGIYKCIEQLEYIKKCKEYQENVILTFLSKTVSPIKSFLFVVGIYI